MDQNNNQNSSSVSPTDPATPPSDVGFSQPAATDSFNPVPSAPFDTSNNSLGNLGMSAGTNSMVSPIPGIPSTFNSAPTDQVSALGSFVDPAATIPVSSAYPQNAPSSTDTSFESSPFGGSGDLGTASSTNNIPNQTDMSNPTNNTDLSQSQLNTFTASGSQDQPVLSGSPVPTSGLDSAAVNTSPIGGVDNGSGIQPNFGGEPSPFVPPAPELSAVSSFGMSGANGGAMPPTEVPGAESAQDPSIMGVNGNQEAVDQFVSNLQTQPVAPADTAPTDLSHLIDSSQPTVASELNGTHNTSVVPQTENLVVPVAASNPSENVQTSPAAPGFPKWLFLVGLVLILLVAGASAYFILGVGKISTQTKSSNAGEQPPLTTPSKPLTIVTPTPVESTIAAPAADFGAISGSGSPSATQDSSNSATSALELLKQRQSSTNK